MLNRLLARFYDRMMEPLERAGLRERRRALLSDLEGDVLELGAGTGLGLTHYRRAARVVQLEPDPYLRGELEKKVPAAAVPVEVVRGRAERLPFPDESFDVVATTLVLCSVADPGRALAEVHRVLRPGGKVVLIEHVRGEGKLGRAQDFLAPIHRLLAGGCSPNRRTADEVRRAGFDLQEQPFTLRGSPDVLVRPAFQGVATKKAGA